MISFKQFLSIREAAERHSEKPVRLPPVLIFKRRTTRMFPNGQEVSAYYSDELKKTYIFPNSY